MVGREAERSAIASLVEAARMRQGGVLFFAGEPGSGKTTLLNVARAAAQGMTVLATEGVQSESNLAFSGLAALLRPIMGCLSRIPQVQAASLAGALALAPPAPTDRFTTYLATLSLISAAAEEQPLLVLVDDVQWLDPSSAEAILFTARRLTDERVAMVMAMRSNSEAWLDPAGLKLFELAPLGGPESLAILRRHSRRIATEVAEAIVAASAGNPLALIELPPLLSDAQLRGDEPLPDPLPVGPRLKRAFQPRLSKLPPTTQRLLLVAASTAAVPMTTLTRAAASMGLAADTALIPAEEAGLIQVGDEVRFVHPLIRAAVYESARAADRRQAHAAIAAALPDAAAGQRALQRAAAALAPDEAIAGDLEDLAGQEHARRGYRSAAHIAARAAVLSPRAEDQIRRLAAAALSAQLGGDGVRAVAYLDRALGITVDPAERADLTLQRYAISTWLENPMAAHDALVSGATLITAQDPARAARLAIHAVAACFMAGDNKQGRATAMLAYQLALRSNEPETIARAELTLRGAQFFHGEGVSTLAPVAVGVSAFLAGNGPVPPDLSWAAYWLVIGEEYELARAALERSIRQFRASGALAMLPYPLAVLSELEFRTGAWLDAYTDAIESVRIARETGQENGRTFSLVCLARVEGAIGHDAQAQAHLGEAMRIAADFQTGSIPQYVCAVEGHLAVGRERWEAAVAPLERLRRRFKEVEIREPGLMRWQADLTEAYLRTGDRAKAIVVLEELELDVQRTGRRWGRVTVARARAMMAEPDDVDQRFSSATELAAGAPDPFEKARTHLAFGERLRRLKRLSDARTHLHAALEVFDGLGAHPWANRAQHELAATGERIRREPRGAMHALTPAELQVCRAVAIGQTNREVAAHLFITLKTVETHLTSAYHKLGLRSRSELARLFAREPEGALELSLPR